MKQTKIFLSIVACIFYPGLIVGVGDVMATQEAKYTVLEKHDDFELRQYEPQIVAETLVEGDFKEVGNEGFRRLFGYISGKNRKKQSIPMTAPVSQEIDYEKIAMTAPVNQVRVGEKWRITFLMPPDYTMDTLPDPFDVRITLKESPGQVMAAYRYRGTWRKSLYEEKKDRLMVLIKEHGLKPVGEPVFARYNPPFMPWFLRRNEVLVPVEILKYSEM
jgi:SOUL heme-binding protein